WLVHMGEMFQLTKTGGWALELQGLFLFSALAVALLGAGRYSVGGIGGRWNRFSPSFQKIEPAVRQARANLCRSSFLRGQTLLCCPAVHALEHHPESLMILTFIAGLIALVAGAERLVRGASRLALSIGIPPLVVGLTIVAFGTSAPEMAVGVGAVLDGRV